MTDTNKEYIRGLDKHLDQLTRRYPQTHGPDIQKTLHSLGSVDQIDQMDIVLNSLRIPPGDLLSYTDGKRSRQALAQWFASPRAELDFQAVELRLFTNGQEIIIGWEKHDSGRETIGWVLRTIPNVTDEDTKRMLASLEKLAGLVPQTKVIREGQQALILSEFIEGTPANEEDIAAFRHDLATRGISESELDFKDPYNLIKSASGKLIYVDRDYLGIGHR